VLLLCICGRAGNVFGSHLYGIVWKYVGGLMCARYVPGKYGKHNNGTNGYYFLWRINSSHYVDSDTEW